MGKEKSTYSSKNNLGSRRILCAGEKPKKSKKSNGTKESDLALFKNFRSTSKRNKLNDIDEKLVKAQLVQSKKCEDFNCFQIDKKNFKPIFVSTPAKFSKQMKGKTRTKIFIDNEEQNPKNLLLNIKPQEEMYEKFALNSQINKSNVPLLSQQKIEELLYKSFILQNFNSSSNFFLHDKSNSVLKKSATKTRKKEFKFKKQSKNSIFNQQHLNRYYRLTQTGKKRRTNSDSSLSDVEVINLENSSYRDMKPDNNIICIDLDVEDCDWNDPFDLNNIELSSKQEIIEGFEKKKAVETEKLKFNNTDVQQSEISYCNDEKDKTQLKKVWECPICFEQSKGQEVVATQCGHVFCKICLEGHFSKFGKTCPSCRSNLKKKPYITLFNF